jgi:hypothetical protein
LCETLITSLVSRSLSRFGGAIITDAANKASVLTRFFSSAPRAGLSIDKNEIAQICIFIFQYSLCTWLEVLISMPTPSSATVWEKLAALTGMFTYLFIMSHEFFLLTDLISDCSDFQSRNWFAVCGCQGHPSLGRSCLSWWYGCCFSLRGEGCTLNIDSQFLLTNRRPSTPFMPGKYS